MNPFPARTALGDLEMVEVYHFFDGPRLFTCRNSARRLFLGMWVDEAPGEETWLYVRMTDMRFQFVRRGRIELRKAVTEAEDGFVFVVHNHLLDHTSRVEARNAEDVPDEWLPLAGEFLSVQEEASPERWLNDLQEDARRLNREAAKLRLAVPGMSDMAAPLGVVGPIFTTAQSAVDAIAISLREQAHGKPDISIPELLSHTRLYSVEQFYGSFGVKLIGWNSGELVGRSILGDALEKLVDLLSVGSNAEALMERLKVLKPRAAKKYRDFLKSLVESETDAALEWATPNANRPHVARISVAQAREAMDVISRVEPEVVTQMVVRGHFVALHLRTKHFEFWEDEGLQAKFKGRIAPSAFSEAGKVKMDEAFFVRIQRTTVRMPLTEEEESKDELLNVAPVTPPQPGGEEPPVFVLEGT